MNGTLRRVADAERAALRYSKRVAVEIEFTTYLKLGVIIRPEAAAGFSDIAEYSGKMPVELLTAISEPAVILINRDLPTI